jgi:hypothetical protein
MFFLAARIFEECFVFDIFSEAPESEKAIKFADYVVNNYIDKSSTFPPITWADSDVECKRTTNGCESFHKEFSTMGLSQMELTSLDSNIRPKVSCCFMRCLFKI